MKKTLILLLLIATQLSCQEKNEKSRLDNSEKQRIEQAVDELTKKFIDLDIFSGVVLIADHGKPLYHKAFGMADRSTGRLNDLNTHFDIGSMNKALTKVAVLKLVKSGKLNLGDPLSKFIEGFPTETGNKVTVEHLLNHSSGYGDYHGPDYWNRPKSEKNIKNIVSKIMTMPLLFEPGTDQEYSNAGYVLLGAIIEKVTGQSYYDVIEQMVVQPLGLKETYLREKYDVPNRAIGYMKTMRGVLEDNDSFQELPKPDGGFYSTTTDMLRFFRAYHYGDELWDQETRSLDKMYDFYQEHRTTGGAMSHAGGFDGANTVHFEILRDEISVMVFANMNEPVAEQLGEGILAIIRGKEPRAPALPALESVYHTLKNNGLEYVKANFETLTVSWHPADPKDMILNNIGYNLMYSENKTEQRLSTDVMHLNTELFPEVANTWDSYGEALLRSGDKEGAKTAYKKALEIRPDLITAKEALDKL